MNKAIGKTIKLIPVAAALLMFFASCTTKRLTVSPYAWHTKVKEIENTIKLLPHDYQPVGFGSEVINDVVVTGRLSNDIGGYDTLMDNDPAVYDNYVYQDSLGNMIDFVLKRKEKSDNRGYKYVYDIEVAKCNCTDRNVYYDVCSPNGIVHSAVRIEPDQQSKFTDWNKVGLYGLVGVGVAGIITFITGAAHSNPSFPSSF